MAQPKYLWLICLSLFLSACDEVSEPSVVDVNTHDSFWLWAGVTPQPVLDNAKSVYILDSELRAQDGSTLAPLRPAIPEIDHADIWMVVRVETLDWSPAVTQQIMGRLEGWAAKNRLVGLQIDFDADTRELDGYAEFLSDLRKRLPEKYKFSITGLLDWSANGDPAALVSLSNVIDEAVFQTYQGRKTIPGYENWLGKLDGLPMPFKIGLVQGGEWQEPSELPKNPNFQGYVVFLLNPDTRDSDQFSAG